MACIKGVNRSASVALSPESPYLAAGTMAGAVDISFSSSANLEIFKLDFQSDDHDLPLVGGTPSAERFNRISWGKTGSLTEKFSYGLIAGGLVDGTIDILNPLALISPETGESVHVKQLSQHKGPVRGLEFNTFTPHLLASGADEGEICIWDLTTPSEPNKFPSLQGSGSAAQGEISFLSWNSKVHHVLASASYNGTTVVWDLKKAKPVISFQDQTRRRCSVLQWHPDVATQLFVASDDDNSPSLQLWDMRNTMSPVKEFVGHTKGVIAMSWCPSDNRYLLTCAKDNRTICWDTFSGEIVCELPTGTNWNFDIHWYPKIPGVITASSFDGNIGIYNIEACSRYGTEGLDFSPAPLKAPKWLKRPVGVSFGFGGKLVSFHPRPSSEGDSGKPSEVYVHTLVTEDSLVSRSSEFEAAINNGERSSIRVLCEQKSQESESEADKETWGFLKVMFEDDGTARTKLLAHLGFSPHTEVKDGVEEELPQEANTLSLQDTTLDTDGIISDKEATFDNGEDFFNNLPSPKADTPLSVSGDKFVIEDTLPAGEETQQDLNEHEESVDASFDDAVQRALVVGDYKAAVEQCIAANKFADALVIAHVGGASLWESTRDQYLKICHSPYLKVISAMVNNDLMSLVHTRPLKFWKETLALLCSFAQRDEWTLLCNTLASKLMKVGNTLAATLCYICAGNIDKTVEIWSRNLAIESEGKPYVDLFQDLMEKTIVLALATGEKRFSESLYKLIEKYAEILASQGLLTTAMEYLKLLGSDELSPELLILRDRIALCAEPEKEVSATTTFENTQQEKEVSATTTFENTQQGNGHVYGAGQPSYGAVETSRQYYQETMPPQGQQNVPGSPYEENYQQPSFDSYGNGGYGAPASYQMPGPQPNIFVPSQAPGNGGYGAPASYQMPGPQPNIFVPSQAPQVPQATFAPTPTTQPTARPFVPSTPAVLRNAGQYQQPTLGSQLYPGTTNSTYQPGPTNSTYQPGPTNPTFQPGPTNLTYQPGPPNPTYQPGSTNPTYQPGPPGAGSHGPIASQGISGSMMPHAVAPTPPPRGFMPVNNTGVAQRPAIGSMQPPSPTQQTVQPPVVHAGPPPTVQTADTSKVPAHQKPVITTLTRLFHETSEAVGGSRANPAKKREIDDNSRKIGALFAKLNNEDISKNAAENLVQLCKAVDNGDFATALQIQVQLTTSDWDECNFWLATLKRMIKTRQNVRLS